MTFGELVRLLHDNGFILIPDLPYSLVIEATADPACFRFRSPELEGFTGEGRSPEDCLEQARARMLEHVAALERQNLPVPPPRKSPRIVVPRIARAQRAG